MLFLKMVCNFRWSLSRNIHSFWRVVSIFLFLTLYTTLFWMTRWTGSYFQCMHRIRFYGLFCLWYVIVIQRRWKWNPPHLDQQQQRQWKRWQYIVTTTMMMTPKMDSNGPKVTTTNDEPKLWTIRWFATKYHVCKCCYVSLLHFGFIWPKWKRKQKEEREIKKWTKSNTSLVCALWCGRVTMRMFNAQHAKLKYTIESNVQFHLNFIRWRTNKRSAEVGENHILFQLFVRQRTKWMCILFLI